ncbi:TIM barrel protein [Streptomyces marincola]|nr:TIM barrel protein [Streptomyces marincola]
MRRDQIDHRWIEQVGGIEAYVFDGDDLAGEDHWRLLAENLRHIRALGARALTLHFPTEHADWVHDGDAYRKLLRFCEVAAEHGAAGVTLHANQFVAASDWPGFDVAERRRRVLGRLAELDAALAHLPIWIGVENLPVIGVQGIDYDPVFVYPADFAGLAEIGSPRLGVTWDICHWAVTHALARAVGNLTQRPTVLDPLDLPEAPLRHIHFASFAGIALPHLPYTCTEGVAPQDGDADPGVLAGMLGAALDRAPGAGVVFEVQEEDYGDRRTCWSTLSWLRSVPALRGRFRNGGS